jgi:hypothetical protein
VRLPKKTNHVVHIATARSIPVMVAASRPLTGLYARATAGLEALYTEVPKVFAGAKELWHVLKVSSQRVLQLPHPRIHRSIDATHVDMPGGSRRCILAEP